MKLRKQLLVNGSPLPIIDDHVKLVHNAPGQAVFTVESDITPKGRVVFNIRYAKRKKYTQFFVGFVEIATQKHRNVWIITCREASLLLSLQLPLALRHVTTADVLNELSSKTGLSFNLPQQDYANQKAAYFYTTGSGIHAMDHIGHVFEINNYVWYQQGDGRVYCGSWAHSQWATSAIQIPPEFNQQVVGEQLKIPVISTLRPLAVINNKQVAALELKDQHMVITWLR